MTDETTAVADGQAALERINTQGKRLIDEWVAVGRALAFGEAIKSNQARGTWHLKHFPDLAGQKHASTRRAAVWLAKLATEDASVLQSLKNDGHLNHPVAIKDALDRKTKAENGTSLEDTLQDPPKDEVESEADTEAEAEEDIPSAEAVEEVDAEEDTAPPAFDYAALRAKVDVAMGWVRDVVSELAHADEATVVAALHEAGLPELNKLHRLLIKVIDAREEEEEEAAAAPLLKAA